MGIFWFIYFQTICIGDFKSSRRKKCKEKVVILCIIGIYYDKESMWED